MKAIANGGQKNLRTGEMFFEQVPKARSILCASSYNSYQ
jgi:hypothetical protein